MHAVMLREALLRERQNARFALAALQGVTTCSAKEIEKVVAARDWLRGRIEEIDADIERIQRRDARDAQRRKLLDIVIYILAALNVLRLIWQPAFERPLVAGLGLFALFVIAAWRAQFVPASRRMLLAVVAPLAVILGLQAFKLSRDFINAQGNQITALGVIYAVVLALATEKRE